MGRRSCRPFSCSGFYKEKYISKTNLASFRSFVDLTVVFFGFRQHEKPSDTLFSKTETMDTLGIDIGASGIKGACVDTTTGRLTTERHRIGTPHPSTPKRVASVIAELKEHFDWSGPIGCGFPSVVRSGVVQTAANVDDKWVGTDARKLFADATDCAITLINDADAAGLAEMKFGAGRGHNGVVFLVTIGTGLGSAFFTGGRLLPNTEMGQIQLLGKIAERYASDAIRKKEELSWPEWALRFNAYLGRIELLFSPDLIIIGGGASKKYQKYKEHLSVAAEIVPAELRNEAGIVGAALSVELSRNGQR